MYYINILRNLQQRLFEDSKGKQPEGVSTVELKLLAQLQECYIRDLKKALKHFTNQLTGEYLPDFVIEVMKDSEVLDDKRV